MQYLDPKADLTFKKVFGQHKDLAISLINALLPLPEDGQVTSIEYLTPELMPETPLGRNSIVDVRCKDQRGRQFLVEMQTVWTPSFMARVVFNSSKAYVRQIEGGEEYKLLQPVYSLNLVNDIFLRKYPDEFIHHYDTIHRLHSDEVIEGLHFTFVELPKFKPQTIAERRMAVLWLRFLTEINASTEEAPAELLSNDLTSKALEQVWKSGFTKDELYFYEKFWDNVSVEKTLFLDATEEGREKGYNMGKEDGRAEGRAEGKAEGRAEGKAEGIAEANINNARNFLACGVDPKVVAQCTGLPLDEVLRLVGE